LEKEICRNLEVDNLKDLFEQGVSFRTFILNQEPEMRANFMKHYITLDIKDEYRVRLDQVDNRIGILGVVEGWCADCHINLSILAKLISTNHNINLKLITKDDAGNRFEKYYENGELRVPTFVFLDDNFIERAVFIEKPDIVKSIDIDTLQGAKIQMSYKAGKLINETVLQLLELIEKTS
jgi:hypothetical protein